MNREADGREWLLGLFPELYREQGGNLLRGYVAVAQELLDDLERRIERAGSEGEESVWLRGAGLGFGDRLGNRNEDEARLRETLAGTALGLAAWLGAECPRPAVWNGIRLRPLGRGCFEILRSNRSCVLAWGREDAAALADDPDFPEWLFPAGVRIEAVLLEEPPGRVIPVHGARLTGEVFWCHHERNVARGAAWEEG